ncbi:MAG: hypothetical protein WCF57_09645 [Pyrinomonadaceae bacterium]
MKIRLPRAQYKTLTARMLVALAAFSILSFSTALNTFAQRSFSKTYPARSNVRLELRNWSGAIIVEAWNRNEIKITAQMESPAARFTPEMSDTGLKIDVVNDNRGRRDIGAVNFRVQVPVNSTVDLETKRGDITVRGVQGSMVRAHVGLEGDIELTDIRSLMVKAENIMGDILFDGELLSGGSYDIQSVQGNINIRIPYDSAFRLVATAPLTRSITLDSFAHPGLNYVSDGRKVIGNVGDGRASLTITNQRGRISFIRR